MLESNQHRRFWRPPCYQLHQCHIPDLVNVQVGKTFGMVEWVLPPTARSWAVKYPVSPFFPLGHQPPDSGRKPLISHMSQRGYSSNAIDLTGSYPMKPRANPGNRTQQLKSCASRFAKPARLGCASQNHLTMIILSKTGATTVAQHDCEPLAVHAQSETAVCERHVLCANFSKTRALFLLLSHRP